MQPKSRRAAWIQGVVLVVAVVALAMTLALRLRRPFDRDTLAIPVDELRSQAAEAGMLEEQLRRDHLAPAFVRFHARQLGHDVGRLRDTLGGKRAEAGLDPLRMQAMALAATLQARLDTLARDGTRPRTAGLQFDTLVDSLDALGRRIKPEG